MQWMPCTVVFISMFFLSLSLTNTHTHTHTYFLSLFLAFLLSGWWHDNTTSRLGIFKKALTLKDPKNQMYKISANAYEVTHRQHPTPTVYRSLSFLLSYQLAYVLCFFFFFCSFFPFFLLFFLFSFSCFCPVKQTAWRNLGSATRHTIRRLKAFASYRGTCTTRLFSLTFVCFFGTWQYLNVSINSKDKAGETSDTRGIWDNQARQHGRLSAFLARRTRTKKLWHWIQTIFSLRRGMLDDNCNYTSTLPHGSSGYSSLFRWSNSFHN